MHYAIAEKGVVAVSSDLYAFQENSAKTIFERKIVAGENQYIPRLSKNKLFLISTTTGQKLR